MAERWWRMLELTRSTLMIDGLMLPVVAGRPRDLVSHFAVCSISSCPGGLPVIFRRKIFVAYSLQSRPLSRALLEITFILSVIFRYVVSIYPFLSRRTIHVVPRLVRSS